VVIQLDALRPDHVGFAGYKRPTTRNLDVFRQSATWFSHAYSPMPSTRFAMAAVFTGLDGSAVPQEYAGGPDYLLLPQAETVAERLADVGYERHGLTISYVMQHIRGVGQGFEELKTPWPVDDWASTYATSATRTTDAAMARLETLKDGGAPYFLFVHYQCTHDPYSAQHEWPFGYEPVDLYDSAAAYCDHEVGRLLRTLDARPDRARTALVVFSDHGELFGEHGLTAHGNSLYEPDARALLLFRMPGGRRTETVDTNVSLTDLAPTILELAGLAPRPGTDAWSLVPYVTPGAPPRPPRRIFLATDLWRGPVHHLSSGVIEGNYKLIHDVQGRSDELFDVQRDPLERVDLAPAMPELRAHLAEVLEAHGARGNVF
jgi:arylsulfatase A-like enzyme